MFTVDYDDAAGIIRCTGGGFLSVEEVEQYSLAIQGAIARCKREFGSIAVLAVAGADAQIQTAEVMEASRDNWRRHGPDNLMALVVPSALMRLQANRVYSSEREKVFATEPEAMAWLIAGRAAKHETAALASQL